MHVSVALYPGSFDPVTIGHVDVLERACLIAERVIVAVGVNSAKTTAFSVEERVEMLRLATSHLNHVEVVALPTTVVDAVKEYAVSFVVKGVRNGQDLDNEAMQAQVNWELGGVETVFLPTRGQYAHVSSSLVRELIRWRMDLSRYVPASVVDFIEQNRR